LTVLEDVPGEGIVLTRARDRIWEVPSREPLAQAADGYIIRPASSVRDLTPSLWNALCRWYSTVRGLMNS